MSQSLSVDELGNARQNVMEKVDAALPSRTTECRQATPSTRIVLDSRSLSLSLTPPPSLPPTLRLGRSLGQ